MAEIRPACYRHVRALVRWIGRRQTTALLAQLKALPVAEAVTWLRDTYVSCVRDHGKPDEHSLRALGQIVVRERPEFAGLLAIGEISRV